MLEKIKAFFRNLFNIDKQKYIEAPKENIQYTNNVENDLKSNFINQIIINNEEENRVLKLQEDLKTGKIEEYDLSDEDFEALTNLYEKQIKKTKQSIKEYKDKIVSIKLKLEQNA